MKTDVTSNAKKYCQTGRDRRRAAEHPGSSQKTEELVAQAQFRMDAAMRETFLALLASPGNRFPTETLRRRPKPFVRTGALSSRGEAGTPRGTDLATLSRWVPARTDAAMSAFLDGMWVDPGVPPLCKPELIDTDKWQPPPSLRATKTNDPAQKRAFEQAAHEWLKVADDVERMENSRLASSRGTRVRI